MTTAERIAGAGFLGSLADTALPQVFQRIAQEGKSGDLQVTLPKAIKTVYFDRGFVVFASSNLKNDRLGESMIEAGRISRHEFALATMVMRSSKRKFGETLVEAGIVSEEELGQHVARQVNRIVLSLFSPKEGVYSFDERACTIPVELMVSLSVYRILLEGTRRMASKKLVLAGLPPLETKLTIVQEPPFSLDVEKLRPVEKDVLRVARDGARISEIVRNVGGDEGVALRAIYGLVCAGVLEVVATEPRILRVQEETGSFVLSEIRHKVDARKPAEREPEPVQESAETLEVVDETETPEPVFDQEPAPPPVATAVERASAPKPEGLRSRMPGLWKRLWDPIEAALLRWVGSTSELEETLETPPPVSRVVPRERESPPPAPTREVVAQVPAGADEDVGVPSWSIVSQPEESEEVVVPARIEPPPWSVVDPAEQETPVELGPLSALDNELFIETDPAEDEEPSMLSQIPVEEIAIAEEPLEIEIELEESSISDVPGPEPLSAVQTVSEEPSPSRPAEPTVFVDEEPTQEERANMLREEAMRRMKQSGGEGRLLRDVKLHFKLQDWEGAVPLLEQLVSISPGTALYRGMLARAMSRMPALRKDAEEHFVEALRLAPQDPELHYWLGLYYKTFGLNSRAITEFRTTLRINPRHEGARKQLGGGRKDDALGTVLKKIFG
jgi:hypothetical protein